MISLVNMLLGEIIYGGLRSGIYSMIMLVIVSVYIILGAGVISLLTAVAVVTEGERAGLTTKSLLS